MSWLRASVMTNGCRVAARQKGIVIMNALPPDEGDHGTPPPATSALRRRATGVTLALAGLGAGVAIAFAVGANASTATSGSGSTSTAGSATAPSATGQRPNFPAHGTAAHEDAEKAVTGSAATKAQAAAVKSVGSGTAGAVTTDFSGHGYEVTVTKSDGSSVEVHLDSSFNVMQHGPR